jgi:uncharacterized protein
MDCRCGSLTLAQVELLLGCLPLDISFADENDVLVYWRGETYRTCDADAIGRDIRECHPAHSLATLEEILRAFKSAEKDVAQGWEETEGGFSLTRYVAARDETGAYKGIVEINMDVAGFRALTGRQSLPGW